MNKKDMIDFLREIKYHNFEIKTDPLDYSKDAYKFKDFMVFNVCKNGLKIHLEYRYDKNKTDEENIKDCIINCYDKYHYEEGYINKIKKIKYHTIIDENGDFYFNIRDINN